MDEKEGASRVTPLREVSRRSISVRAIRQLLLRVGGAALGVVTAGILARCLGTDAFGDFSLALTLAGTGTAVADMGLTQVALRQIALRPSDRPDIVGGLIIGRTVLGLAAMVITMLLALALADGQAARVAAIIVLSTLALTGFGAVVAVGQSRLRPDLPALVSIMQNAIWLTGAAVLGATSAPLWAFGVAFLASNTAQSVAAYAMTRRLTEVSWEGARARAWELFRTGLPYGLAGLCVTDYYRVDGVILYEISGPATSGQFAAAYRFLDSLQLIPSTLASMLVPLIVVRHRDSGLEAAARLYHFAIRLMLAAGVPVIGIAAGVATPLAELVYGDEFREAGHLLAILLPAFAFVALGYVVTSVLIAEGDFSGYARIVFVCAVGNIAANVLLIPKYGADAAAWSTTATEVAVVCLIANRLRRRHGYAAPWRIGVIATFVGALTYLVVYLANMVVGPAPAIVAGGFAYLALAISTGLLSRQDVSALLSNRVEAKA